MRWTIRVDPSRKEPLYRQLVEALTEQMAEGRLESGLQLPSVREMALHLRINPNTVARAYRELEAQGLVVSQRGKGVFVADRQPLVGEGLEPGGEMDSALDQLLRAARERGISIETLVAELRRRASRKSKEE